MADVTTYERAPGREARMEASGSIAEVLGGGAVIVLAILGLVRIDSPMLAAIATIVLGAAFLAEGGTLAARFMRAARTERWEAASSDVAMESMCGASGVVLGILALLGIHPAVLIPASLVVFGAGMLSASGTAWRVGSAGTTTMGAHLAQETFDFTGPQLLIGFAGIVLGILALAGYTPITFSLVGLLTLGFGVLLSGTWMATRFASLLSW